MAKIAGSTGLSADLFTPFSVLTRQGYDEIWELISAVLS
jgi:hypothetical protein